MKLGCCIGSNLVDPASSHMLFQWLLRLFNTAATSQGMWVTSCTALINLSPLAIVDICNLHFWPHPKDCVSTIAICLLFCTLGAILWILLGSWLHNVKMNAACCPNCLIFLSTDWHCMCRTFYCKVWSINFVSPASVNQVLEGLDWLRWKKPGWSCQ